MQENIKPEEFERKPRTDLTEEAFRRYEQYMARACHAMNLVVEPWEFPPSKTRAMKKAATFIARFNDAKNAYRRYRYKSDFIPANFNIDNLKVCELTSGAVLIENHQYGPKAAPIESNDHDGLRALALKLKGGFKLKPGILIRMVEDSAAEDEAFIRALETEFEPYFVCAPEIRNGFLWVLPD